VLVAGGYNSNDYFMKSVEFLDLSGMYILYSVRGRILGRNWHKSLKSFPPCYSVNSTNGFYYRLIQVQAINRLFRKRSIQTDSGQTYVYFLIVITGQFKLI
jgi:hypothetical protein